eukprot:7746731-Heterocapsa_arctica.AAC.1
MVSDPRQKEKASSVHPGEAESRALAQLLQAEEDEGRQEELDNRALAQALQDEEDTEATAKEWINFFQQPADNEVPDICMESDQFVWRSSGSGTTSGKDSDKEGSCMCGAICPCLRRYGGKRRHTHRSSLRASWIRARRDLRESEGD